MPQLIPAAQFLLQVTVATLAPGLGAAAINATAAAILGAATSFALTAATSSLFAPDAPSIPKPEDGKFNFKQAVPSLPFVLGRVEKGGDYVLLEEDQGIAYHITVVAAHSIRRFVRHRLHDEDAEFNNQGEITSPEHFIYRDIGRVNLLTRLGNDSETAFQEVVDIFPDIWTQDHRGDGLASVLMRVESVPAQEFRNVFPQQMPQQKHVIDGNDRIYDPRTDSYGYTTNLALFRLWHLTHPVGGKLTLDDMYMPDWIRAADVCDQQVVNRSGQSENRYHGGIWFRANNDPVDIGRTLDEAAELVIYERADGKIGVHAGELVNPITRLDEADILTVSFDANRRQSTSVLAVRGQYTEPEANYTTADAAHFGDPYIGENTERTRDVRNTAVQSHNHISRLQKLAFTRANSPRVNIVAEYEAARDVLYSRFIRVHLPPRMDEAIVEIVGPVRKSLGNLTVEFQGIIVPDTLYNFDAFVDEGVPPAEIVEVESRGVPVPQGFDVIIQNEVVSGGSTSALGVASWDIVSDSLQYELQWFPRDGGTTQSILSVSGDDTARSSFLVDGVEYGFRLRTISGGAASEFTETIYRIAMADPVAPDPVLNVVANVETSALRFNWTAPNSANYFAARIYIGTSNVFENATLAIIENGSANQDENVLVEGLQAGGYYGFIEAINASGVAAEPVETGLLNVT